MASEPAFLFYVKDWRSSRKVQGMNFATRGMYLEMLLEQFDAGSVPGSPAECAALLGGTVTEWQRAWPKIKPCFTTKKLNGRSIASGRMINLRLEAVRVDRLRYKKSQAESGLRGAQKRWRKDRVAMGSPSTNDGSPMANRSSSSSSSSSFDLHSTPAPDGAGEPPADVRLRERFDTFWLTYPRKVAKAAAWRAWQKRRPDAGLAAQIDAALAWQRTQDNWLREGGRFIPHPSTYLNQGRWEDERHATPLVSDRTLSIGRAAEEFLNHG